MAKSVSRQMERRGEPSLSTVMEAGGAPSQGSTTDAPTRASAEPVPPPLGPTLLRVVWLAILLGLAMEGLLLLLGSGFGEFVGLRPGVADLVKNVTWSVFVCGGLAVGKTLSKIHLPAMGLLGFLAAPTAFEVSRVFHKGTLEALAASGGADELSPLLVALIKGLEYGCLGMALAWLGRRPWGGAFAHAAAGLVLGLIFGGLILWLLLGSSPQPPAAEIFSRGMNEVLFPVGCSLVLFSAGALGERVAAKPRTELETRS
jgi:hypothetical protein